MEAAQVDFEFYTSRDGKDFVKVEPQGQPVPHRGESLRLQTAG